MEQVTQIGSLSRKFQDRALRRLLRGYRFTVCESEEQTRRALEVRRAVYLDECGYDIPVPDEYDARSWLVLAEDDATGAAVGSIRVTCRSAGPIEAEEYFRLPADLRTDGVVEISRFAILPDHRKGRALMPTVALGLFKTVVQLLIRAGTKRAVVCAKPERVWSYSWMRFQQTGVQMPYVKLGGAPHELLLCDMRYGVSVYDDHRFYDFFVASVSPEIHIPETLPVPGTHCGGGADLAADPLVKTA